MDPPQQTKTEIEAAQRENEAAAEHEKAIADIKREIESLRAERERERQARLAAEERIRLAEERIRVAQERTRLAEEQLLRQNKPIGDCICKSPFITKPFLPKCGDPLGPGESEVSTTTTARAWLDVGPDHVEQWTDEKLVQFLQEADDVMIERDGTQVHALQLIKEGKADIMLQNLLNGTSAAGKVNELARGRGRVLHERLVETILIKYLWMPLEMIMGGIVDVESVPITKYARLYVTPGELAGTASFIPMAPQYAKFYRVDRVIEFEHPPTNIESADVSQHDEAVDHEKVRRCSRIVVEVKPDVFCPKPRISSSYDESEAKNQAFIGNLVDYIKSPYFDPQFNPAAQVVTYGFAFRTKCVMIHTLNQMTLGLISDEDPTNIRVLLSKKFDCTVPLPFESSVPSAHPSSSWSLWEVLVRFILASTKHWYLKHFPDALKAKFKQRPAPARADYPLAPLSYADLWAPLRFALPATHPIEEEATLKKLDGDAEFIGRGRMGPVYRQTLQGRDVAVKLLIFTVKREIDDMPRKYPYSLREEMSYEVEVYKHLSSLQGKTIPVLLWHGTLIEGISDALATEYCGERLPDDGVSEVQKTGALAALDSLHENGVLHGDIASRNFVCKGDAVRTLDFGFSQFREDLTETEWLEGVQKEKAMLKQELGIKDLESHKRVHMIGIEES